MTDKSCMSSVIKYIKKGISFLLFIDDSGLRKKEDISLCGSLLLDEDGYADCAK